MYSLPLGPPPPPHQNLFPSTYFTLAALSQNSSDRSLQVCECVQALKRHHVQLRYKDSDPFMPSTGGTCLHPCPPLAAEPAPPSEQAPAPGPAGDWVVQYLNQFDEGGGDVDNGADVADFDDGWQQALWADAHAVHHAA